MRAFLAPILLLTLLSPTLALGGGLDGANWDHWDDSYSGGSSGGGGENV